MQHLLLKLQLKRHIESVHEMNNYSKYKMRWLQFKRHIEPVHEGKKYYKFKICWLQFKRHWIHSWIAALCLLILKILVKIAPQMSTLKDFTPSWTVVTCTFKSLFHVKPVQQMFYLKGFFPSWTKSMCTFKWVFRAKIQKSIKRCKVLSFTPYSILRTLMKYIPFYVRKRGMNPYSILKT